MSLDCIAYCLLQAAALATPELRKQLDAVDVAQLVALWSPHIRHTALMESGSCLLLNLVTPTSPPMALQAALTFTSQLMSSICRPVSRIQSRRTLEAPSRRRFGVRGCATDACASSEHDDRRSQMTQRARSLPRATLPE